MCKGAHELENPDIEKDMHLILSMYRLFKGFQGLEKTFSQEVCYPTHERQHDCEGEFTAYRSGLEKQTHHGTLWEETEMHRSCREKSHGEGCSGEGYAAHLVHIIIEQVTDWGGIVVPGHCPSS